MRALRRSWRRLGAGLAAMALAGCASIAAHEAGRALRAQQIGEFLAEQGVAPQEVVRFGPRLEWTVLDERHLILWKHRRDPVLLTLDGPCPDLEWAQAIQVDHFGGLHSVRAGIDGIRVLRSGPSPRGAMQPVASPRCLIRSMHPLTIEQYRALLGRLRGR